MGLFMQKVVIGGLGAINSHRLQHGGQEELTQQTFQLRNCLMVMDHGLLEGVQAGWQFVQLSLQALQPILRHNLKRKLTYKSDN
jgi:hypothetical protein